jgi:hypothetical protein
MQEPSNTKQVLGVIPLFFLKRSNRKPPGPGRVYLSDIEMESMGECEIRVRDGYGLSESLLQVLDCESSLRTKLTWKGVRRKKA